MKLKNEVHLEKSIKNLSVYFKTIGLIVAFIIIFSGITFVEQGEIAIVYRFGKLHGQTLQDQIKEPGLHIFFPYIIDEVIKMPVERVREIKINDLYSQGYLSDPKISNYAITGDENIVLVDAILKYKIVDPIKYSTMNKDVNQKLKNILTGELIKKISSMEIDDVILRKNNELEVEVLFETSKISDRLNLGVLLISLEFININPPIEVRNYFDMLNSTKVQNMTLIQEAKGYREKTINSSNSESESLILNANSYSYQKISQAYEELYQFNAIVEEYNRNPKIVHERIYREKLEEIMKKVEKKIFLPSNSNENNIILP